MTTLQRVVVGALVVCCAFLNHQGRAAPPPASDDVPPARVTGSFPFEANAGQFDPRIRFAARKGARVALATDEGVVLVQHAAAGQAAAVRVRLAGARAAAPEPERRLEGIANYFIGNDPSRWRSRIPTFGQIRYRDAYPGIDLVYHEAADGLEYDFVVEPGADPRAIEIVLDGADDVTVSDDGDVDIRIGTLRFPMRRPVAYERDGALVSARFVKHGSQGLTVDIGDYDRAKTLVIDPVLVWSTYVGGSYYDVVMYGSLDVGPGGTYVSGFSASIDLPTTLGSFQPQRNGDSDAFVAKLDPKGTALLYCTYLGGSASDEVKDNVRPIAVDAAGNAYVTGRTSSTDFPTTTGAFMTSFGGGSADVFVSKLSPNGDTLAYSTLLGGDGGDFAYAIVVDPAGSAYVGGHTRSTDFPTTSGAAHSTGAGFVTKLDPSGRTLLYSTRLEYTITYVLGLARDSTNAIYATGQGDPQFETTPGSAQPMHGGADYDVFVTKINPAGSAYVYSTFIGGSGDELAYAIAVDASGNAYVAGRTESPNFPTSAGAMKTTLGPPADAFVAKVDSTGSKLVFSTLLGRDGDDAVFGIDVDSAANVWVGGRTGPGFPLKNSCLPDPTKEGVGFLTALTPTGQLGAFSTALPAPLHALKRDPQGFIHGVLGPREEIGFTVPGAFDTTHNGDLDALVFQMSPVVNTGAPGCQPCNGDHDSGATRACPDAERPACRTDGIEVGSCTECSATNRGRCTGAKPTCDLPAGTCACKSARDCAGGTGGSDAGTLPPTEGPPGRDEGVRDAAGGCSCRAAALRDERRGSLDLVGVLGAALAALLFARRRMRSLASLNGGRDPAAQHEGGAGQRVDRVLDLGADA